MDVRCHVVTAVMFVCLVAVPAIGYTDVDPSIPNWWDPATSDAAVVARLVSMAEWTIDVTVYFEGRLIVEDVLYGSVSPGDTMRLQWQRQLNTIASPDSRPYHEAYVARSEDSPAPRVLWFLTETERGVFLAESSRSALLMSSDSRISKAHELMRGGTAEGEARERVELAKDYLRAILDSRGWLGYEQRSN